MKIKEEIKVEDVMNNLRDFFTFNRLLFPLDFQANIITKIQLIRLQDKERVKEIVKAYLCNYVCRKNPKIKKLRDGILKEVSKYPLQ